MSDSRVWVDTNDGTWGGDVKGLRIVVIPESFVEEFSEMADDDRSAYALDYGWSVYVLEGG